MGLRERGKVGGKRTGGVSHKIGGSVDCGSCWWWCRCGCWCSVGRRKNFPQPILIGLLEKTISLKERGERGRGREEGVFFLTSSMTKY